MGKFVTTEEVRGSVAEKASQLTEREKRVAPAEHTLVDPRTGEAVRAQLNPDTVGQVMRGELKLSSGDRYRVRARDGATYELGGEEAQRTLEEGGTLLDVRGETRERHEEVLSDMYEDQHALSAGIGAADALTLGGFSAAGRALGEEEALREITERAPVSNIVGQVGATIGTLGLGGSLGAVGAVARSTPLGLGLRGAAATGRGTASLLGGGKLARGVGLLAAGGAEGAVMGVGEGVTQVAQQAQPIDLETAVADIGSAALTGTALGVGGTAVISGGGKLVGGALRKGSKMLDDYTAKGQAAEGIADDLATLDRTGLRKAKEAELEVIKATKATDKVQLAEDVRAHTVLRDEIDPFQVGMPSHRAVLDKQKKALRNRLGDRVAMERNPRSAVTHLRRELEVLREMSRKTDDLMADAAQREAKILKKLDDQLDDMKKGDRLVFGPKSEAAKVYGNWAGRKLSPNGLAKPSAVKFRAALESGELVGKRQATSSRLGELMDSSESLLKRIDDVYLDPTSQRLEEIALAGDTFAERTAKGGGGIRGALEGHVGRTAIGGLAYGPTGAALGLIAPRVLAKVNDVIGGAIAKVAQASAKRGSTALDALMSMSAKVGRVVRPGVTQTLVGTSYGPRSERKAVPSEDEALTAYRERAEELYAATTPGPDGQPQVKPARREEIAANLRAVAAVDPVAADKMEATAARRIEYLTGQLPKRPDAYATQMGPDRWRPSDMDIADFSRKMAAVEDPWSVLERVADGTVTPGDAEAIRAVYPEIFAQQEAEILGRVGELDAPLPYDKRLSLSIFLGYPVDPSLDPGVVGILQGHFAEGVHGGGTPPVAQPQFGNVNAVDPATRAQQISQPLGSKL